MVNITQSVAILCDGNNVERSIHSLLNENVMLNFDELIPKLLGARNLNRLIYFREGRHISDKLADRLHEKFYGTVVPCHKSADIPLSIKATQLASKVDTIIIMSGDSDYVDLVKHLKSEGVRVEICAVKANTASILLAEADYFHPITKTDVFKLSGYKRPYQNKRSSGNTANNQNSGNSNGNSSSESSSDNTKSKSQNNKRRHPQSTTRVTSQPVASAPIVNTVPSSGGTKTPAKKVAKKAAKKATKKVAKKVAKKAPEKKSIASKLKSLVSSK